VQAQHVLGGFSVLYLFHLATQQIGV